MSMPMTSAMSFINLRFIVFSSNNKFSNHSYNYSTILRISD